jgi:hypothetical protein
MGLCQPYGGEIHMLMVAEIVIGDRFCNSPAHVLRAKYWVVDWARTTRTSLRISDSFGESSKKTSLHSPKGF